MSLRVAFAGTPEFAVPPLAALVGSSHTVVGVLTQPDRPAGRGRELRASPVKQYALEHRLAVDQPQTLRTPQARSQLEAWRPDVLVVVAYGLILPQAALDLPRLGCLNIHASLLPRWRGAAPIQRAILAGDAETGVAIMQMEAGLDTGPVLLERRTPIAADDTSGSLHERLAREGAVALLEALAQLEAGRAQPRAQGAAGVAYAHKIDKAEARLDWRRSAAELDRQVRAFQPWPVADTVIRGEVVRVHRARPLAPEAADLAPFAAAAQAAPAGKVLALADCGLLVRCGSGGALALQSLQRPGRKPVTAREFAASLPVIGEVLA
jgi:methionyl-tRNA formyltransferase